jgi:dye decolorizing peroxidase
VTEAGSRLGRRRVLQGTAAALGGAGAGWAGAAVSRATESEPSGSERRPTVLSPAAGVETEPFVGAHQAGIASRPQAHLSLVGLDLRPGVDRPGLARLLRLLSDDVQRLALGDGALADPEPELASSPSRLTVTFGLGPSVVDRLVPAGRTPRVRELPSFSTDRLQPAWGQTDLVLQICGDDLTTVAHARRMLLKDARSFVASRWVQDGFRRARGSEAEGTTMRNVMGQVDGTVNPSEADPDFAGLVWVTEPEESVGATAMVVRRIRAEMDTWDQVGRQGREFAVGRRLDTGAPLTGTREHDEPDFEATDRLGFPVIDPASHVRRARSDDPRHRFHRRSYNYTTTAADGREEAGLVFIAYAADLEEQFVPIQRRLAEQDRLNEWVTTIGSAVYLVPPGVRSSSGYVGEGLVG